MWISELDCNRDGYSSPIVGVFVNCTGEFHVIPLSEELTAKMSKAPPVDPKTEKTFRTIEALRSSGPVFQEFIKAATNYQKQIMQMSKVGQAFADALLRVAQLQSGDLGEGIAKFARVQQLIETKRLNVSRAIQDDLIAGLQKNVKPEESEVTAFESDYKKTRAAMRDAVGKLEAKTKAAGKKGPQALQEAISILNEKIKEADNLKAEKLRNALLMERRKYCNFLGQLAAVVTAEVEVFNEEMKLKESEQNCKNLAAGQTQLPPDLELLVTAKQTERTYISIQSDGSPSSGGGYSSSYDYDNYENNYNASDNTYNKGGSYPQGGGRTVTALYDFAGEQQEDLWFYAGDVITVTQEDDGGWLTGELNGVTGIFPTSYVK